MIEKRPRQFLAVWSDDGKSVKGSTFEESFYVDGKFWKNETSNVLPKGFADFGTMFSAELQAQHDQLVTDKAKLIADHATKTTDYDSTKAQYDALVIEKAKLIADHAKAITDINEANKTATDTLVETHKVATDKLIEDNKLAVHAKQAELISSQIQVSALEARFAKLLTDLPFDPRICDASAFYDRITKDEFAALSVSDDATLRTIAKTILAYKTNDWPIVFESPETQGMIAYLQGTGFLSEDRIKQLTQDASQAEAYVAL